MLPLIGHARVLQRLTEAFDRDRLPHALIFTGPAGIGKARAALELVAYIACTGAARPCGECAGCMQVAASSHPDLHLLGLPTGKKEIPVDLVRQLKRFAGMQAVAAPRKMPIVDDADRLSIGRELSRHPLFRGRVSDPFNMSTWKMLPLCKTSSDQ